MMVGERAMSWARHGHATQSTEIAMKESLQICCCFISRLRRRGPPAFQRPSGLGRYCVRMMQWLVRQLSSDQNVLERSYRVDAKANRCPRKCRIAGREAARMLRRSQEEAASEHAVLEKLQQYLEPRISTWSRRPRGGQAKGGR